MCSEHVIIIQYTYAINSQTVDKVDNDMQNVEVHADHVG